jgi:hypothetical protein
MLNAGGEDSRRLAATTTKFVPRAEIVTLPVYGIKGATIPMGSAEIVTVPLLTDADTQ